MSVLVSAPASTVTPPTPTRPRRRPLIVSATISSAGGRIELMQEPYNLQAGSTGLTGPTTVPDLSVLPGVDGSYLRGADQDNAGLTLDTLDVLLRVRVTDATPQAVADRVSDLRDVLNTRRYGPAVLEVALSDGTRRTLAIVHTPAAGDFDWDFALRTGIVLIRAVAPSPLWRGLPGEAGPWGLAGGGGGELPFDLPGDLAASSVLGEANPIIVGGDENTWPVLRFRGPLLSVQVERILNGRTRGYELVHPTGLLAGQWLTIRHDPASMLSGGRQVEGPDGSSWSRYLQSGADFFELRPGAQAIRVLVGSATAGAQAAMAWETLYWSAVDG